MTFVPRCGLDVVATQQRQTLRADRRAETPEGNGMTKGIMANEEFLLLRLHSGASAEEPRDGNVRIQGM